MSNLAERSMEPASPFDSLPDEMVVLIFGNILPSGWRVCCRMVCKRFGELTGGSSRRRLAAPRIADGRIVKRAARYRSPFSMVKSLCGFFAQEGSLKCLRYFVERERWPLDGTVYLRAASRGHVEIMEWVHSLPNSAKWVDAQTAFAMAASKGHVNVLAFLRQKNYDWYAGVIQNAATNDRVEATLFALNNGCPYHWTVWHPAVANGHLEMLKIAVSRNLTYSYTTWVRLAKDNNHQHIIDYLTDASFPVPNSDPLLVPINETRSETHQAYGYYNIANIISLNENTKLV